MLQKVTIENKSGVADARHVWSRHVKKKRLGIVGW
jgi:hypothetical protein